MASFLCKENRRQAAFAERKKCLLSFFGREKALGLDEIRMKSREKQVLLHKKQRDNRDSIEKESSKPTRRYANTPLFGKSAFPVLIV